MLKILVDTHAVLHIKAPLVLSSFNKYVNFYLNFIVTTNITFH
jgi:hypothetical protein